MGDTTNKTMVTNNSIFSKIAKRRARLRRALSPQLCTQMQGHFHGSGMIIVVSMVLELIRKINAQLLAHDYEKLM